MVRPPSVAGGAVRKEAELLFFDPVLHITPPTVDIIVNVLCVAGQRSDDVAWVTAFIGMFCFANDGALATPGRGAVVEPGKESLFFTGSLVVIRVNLRAETMWLQGVLDPCGTPR